MRLKLASRKSDLARWQALQVARALKMLRPNLNIDFNFKSSLGDQDLDTPLASMGSKGVFTEDFYRDLSTGQCDLVVHSWKDLPVDDRSDTTIAMTLDRADPRDLLLIPEAVWQRSERDGHLSILTSSPRRIHNLTSALPKLLPRPGLKIEFVNVRGNVPTRLHKMLAQNAGLLLAKAGLDRLLAAEEDGQLSPGVDLRSILNQCRFVILPLSVNPSAPAQGALAVEVAVASSAVVQLCGQHNRLNVQRAVLREREILKHYGGGCHQKIGVTILPRSYGEVVAIRGLTDEGERLNTWRVENSTSWTRAASAAQVFPLQASDNSWFEREPIVVGSAAWRDKDALMVARAEALPPNFTSQPKQILWTAGVRTWQRLVEERGLWVHGTQDGLGEGEDPQLAPLLSGPLRWGKVTHLEGAVVPGVELISTYRLKPRAQAPDLSAKTHFFWMSATSFERAFELAPEVMARGFHGTGPGHTWEHLQGRQTQLLHAPKVFVDLAQFLADTLPLRADNRGL